MRSSIRFNQCGSIQIRILLKGSNGSQILFGNKAFTLSNFFSYTVQILVVQLKDGDQMIALPEKILPHSILGFVTNHPTGCQEEYDQTNRYSNNKHRNTNDVMPNFYFSFFCCTHTHLSCPVASCAYLILLPVQNEHFMDSFYSCFYSTKDT